MGEPSSSMSSTALATPATDLPMFYAALTHLSRSMRFPVRLYIQMQLCETDTLATWLQNRNRVVHLEYNMRLWTQIVEGVRHIHDHGLVHRDIKPGNIFVEAVHAPLNQVRMLCYACSVLCCISLFVLVCMCVLFNILFLFCICVCIYLFLSLSFF